VTVDDDGPGIPVEHRTDVFRRFTRLDDARDRDGGGVGLGLAIVADIVAAHGGTVELTDARRTPQATPGRAAGTAVPAVPEPEG
jgi:signal transduction histidine kinase